MPPTSEKGTAQLLKMQVQARTNTMATVTLKAFILVMFLFRIFKNRLGWWQFALCLLPQPDVSINRYESSVFSSSLQKSRRLVDAGECLREEMLLGSCRSGSRELVFMSTWQLLHHHRSSAHSCKLLRHLPRGVLPS